MSENNPFNPYYAQTHLVENQPPELADYNSYTADLALTEAVDRENASWATEDLIENGLHSTHWTNPKPGILIARAAK